MVTLKGFSLAITCIALFLIATIGLASVVGSPTTRKCTTQGGVEQLFGACR